MTQFLQAWQLYPMLPLRAVSVLADEGMKTKALPITKEGDVFAVYVLSRAEARARAETTKAGLTYRVFVKCLCGEDIPFGKMGQHFGSRVCLAGQERIRVLGRGQ